MAATQQTEVAEGSPPGEPRDPDAAEAIIGVTPDTGLPFRSNESPLMTTHTRPAVSILGDTNPVGTVISLRSGMHDGTSVHSDANVLAYQDARASTESTPDIDNGVPDSLRALDHNLEQMFDQHLEQMFNHSLPWMEDEIPPPFHHLLQNQLDASPAVLAFFKCHDFLSLRVLVALALMLPAEIRACFQFELRQSTTLYQSLQLAFG